MTKCLDTEHDYFKFDDASIVCHKCGDQRVVDVAALIRQFPAPIYLPCPHPHYPQPQPWYPPWTVWNDTNGSGMTTAGVPDKTLVLT